MNITKSKSQSKSIYFEFMHISWPKFEDGTVIFPGDRVYVISENKTTKVHAITIFEDGTSQIVVYGENGLKPLTLNQIEKPEPDTFESIIREINPEISEDDLKDYILRLKKIDINANVEDAD